MKIETYIVGNYVIEFPTTINGHQTTYTGFLIPAEKARAHNSQFFTVHNDGKVAYDNPCSVPGYVKTAVKRITRD